MIAHLYIKFNNIPTKVKALLPLYEQIDIIENEEINNWVKLQFIYTVPWISADKILCNFDLDICQIGIFGNKVVCTHAFIQAMATQTFMAYSLTSNSPENQKPLRRIKKYHNRGFTFIFPQKWDTSITLKPITFAMKCAAGARYHSRFRIKLHFARFTHASNELYCISDNNDDVNIRDTFTSKLNEYQ